MSSRAWVGRLDTDEWNDPIVNGFPVDLSEFVGKRVEIVVRELSADPESYEALARSFERAPVTTPATEGTHSVSRPPTAEARGTLP